MTDEVRADVERVWEELTLAGYPENLGILTAARKRWQNEILEQAAIQLDGRVSGEYRRLHDVAAWLRAMKQE